MPVTRDKKTPTPPAAERKAKTPPPPKSSDGGAGGDTDSLADMFDNAKAQGAVAEGKYEAIIRELVLQAFDKEKGQSVRIKYHIITEGDEQGNEITQWYTIFIVVEGAKKPGPGLGFLKRDMAMLGYPDITFGDMEEIFKAITEDEELGVLITVKQNGNFTNAYLNGLVPDTDIVKQYREENPF